MKTIVLPSQNVQATALAVPPPPAADSSEPFGYSYIDGETDTSIFEDPSGPSGKINLPESVLYNGMEREEPGYLRVPSDGVYSFVGGLDIKSGYGAGADTRGFGAYCEAYVSISDNYYHTDPSGTKVGLSLKGGHPEKSGFIGEDGSIINNRNPGGPTVVRYGFSGNVWSGSAEPYSETPFSCFVTVNGSKVGSVAYFRENLTPSGDRVFSVSGSVTTDISLGDEVEVKILDHASGGRRLNADSKNLVQVEVSPPYRHRLMLSVGFNYLGDRYWFPMLSGGRQSNSIGGLILTGSIPLLAGMGVAIEYETECPFIVGDYDRLDHIGRADCLVQRAGSYEAWNDPLWDLIGL